MRAMITGISGQDAAYLAKFLLEKGYEVWGTRRPNSSGDLWRLKSLGIHDHVRVFPMDMTDEESVYNALSAISPEEIYNLAAQSHVGASFDLPVLTMNVNAIAPMRILDAIKHTDTKFYQASTSEMFGDAIPPQNEHTPMVPVSPYGVSKVAAHNAVRMHREAYGTFAVSGILFNHESPLRGEDFVTQKIVRHCMHNKPITLGSMTAKRDWGHAEDYVEGMWLMMRQEKPKDFVLATGESRSVEDFLKTCMKLSGNKIEVTQDDTQFVRPKEIRELRGDARLARKALKWSPKYKFEDLVRQMLCLPLDQS